ncbi:DJ-1/PfpI family protein [Mucilaginibacter polytrichastri]|uniref:Protein DJ-1 n=1 Tax=Mucilaginibacter polytrichastri TaxID=1302689 RepID=A0A1Q5ZY96_9SPHI|nr:DJ-1/PfpI family protein [Mucilaginibacter polytrichastri]OKS86712.1 Protein DJ-1 [Mucilaginibacter polytrichastri]SFS82552.1 4-methyl-5(b-hydroxyethyl)-thiazole monophosphate biosynthesis [Mucilaginibacter polytrichastri]
MKKVLLLLIEGFEFLEASAFIDVMGWNSLEGDRNTRLYTCGLTKEVKSSFSQKVLVDYSIDEIDAATFAALAVPGGFEEYHFYEHAYREEVLQLIRDFHLSDKWVASICTGAFPLAKSGILTGKMGTTYNLSSELQDEFRRLGVNVLQEPIVTDNRIITSWNPSTGIDVAFQLLEHLTSIENVDHVRALMGFQK